MLSLAIASAMRALSRFQYRRCYLAAMRASACRRWFFCSQMRTRNAQRGSYETRPKGMGFLYKLSRLGGRWSLLEAMRIEARAGEVALGRVFISFIRRHQEQVELVFQCKAILGHRLGVGTDLASIHHQGLYTTVDGALGAAAEAVSHCMEEFPVTQFLIETWGPYRMRLVDHVKRQWVDVPPVLLKCSRCGAKYERVGTSALDVDEHIWLCNEGCDGQLVRA